MSNQKVAIEKHKGHIVNIEKYQNRGVYVKQGVKCPDQYKYDKCVTFDVYEDVLAIMGMKKISAQLLEKIQSHEGEKVDVYTNDGYNFSFDARVLLT